MNINPTHTYVLKGGVTIGRRGRKFWAWHHTGWQALDARTIAQARAEVQS